MQMTAAPERKRSGAEPFVGGADRGRDMAAALAVSIGHYSSRGTRAKNQDFIGAMIPDPALARMKGVAVAIADGVSSSEVGHIASETAVKAFFSDYYCTSEAWTVKTSAQRVIAATNAWLHAMTRKAFFVHEREKGYVTTFSAIVFKGATAHLFHVGDARIGRLAGPSLEPLTVEHRIGAEEGNATYLARALGLGPHVEIDYRAEQVAAGDIFVLTTDGVHEHVAASEIAGRIAGCGGDLDAAAAGIAALALQNGSADNVSVGIVRIDRVPGRPEEVAVPMEVAQLPPLPPALSPRQVFDGFEILRTLHVSSRSHVHLARDAGTGREVALKVPASDLSADAPALRRFLMEEWIARRIDNPHVLRAVAPDRRRGWLYTVTEHIDGQSLAQWMRDHPRPSLTEVRGIAGQIARGLAAFHRREMVHQDLRPENILVDRSGVVVIIDFGSVRVAGLAELQPVSDGEPILGTQQYSAPEYFHSETGTAASDIFSLGVIVYQMLTGHLPYGAEVSRIRSRREARRLSYVSARHFNEQVPEWMDACLRKALQPDPAARYDAVSAFIADLTVPNADLAHRHRVPLVERNPLLFWQISTLLLALAVVLLLGLLLAHP
jgi:serine/threonine protein phosphatase PrpC